MDERREAEWFYRVAGQECGPVSTDDLIALVQRRKLFADEMVKLGKDGNWIFAGNIEGLFESNDEPSDARAVKPHSSVARSGRTTTSRSGAASNAAAHALGQRHVRQFQSHDAETESSGFTGGFFESVASIRSMISEPLISAWEFLAEKLEALREKVLGSKIVLAIVGIVFLAAVLRLLPINWRAEPDPYSTYTRLWTELRGLRTAKADDAAWNEFSSRARHELAPIIKRLEQSANSKDRTTLTLLWAGRDHFLQMLADARYDVSESERKFESQMHEARNLALEAHAKSSGSDSLTYAILAVDVLLVVGVAFFVFVGRR